MSEPHIGVDIIEIKRVDEAIEKWNGHFLNRIYSEEELNICKTRVSSLAVRFAAKEAVIKTLDTGFIKTGWKDIEILSSNTGKPFVRLHGEMQKKADAMGLKHFAISLSHCKDYAVAMLVSNAG